MDLSEEEMEGEGGQWRNGERLWSQERCHPLIVIYAETRKKMLSRNRIRLKSSFNFGITKSGVGLIKLNMRKLTS